MSMTTKPPIPRAIMTIRIQLLLRIFWINAITICEYVVVCKCAFCLAFGNKKRQVRTDPFQKSPAKVLRLQGLTKQTPAPCASMVSPSMTGRGGAEAFLLPGDPRLGSHKGAEHYPLT